MTKQVRNNFIQNLADETRILIDVFEKQIPQKPILSNEEHTRNGTCYCPCCGRSYVDYYDNYDNFCPDCGQALDWGEVK